MHLLLILALASAGASPACAFVSGQGTMAEDGLTYFEICRGADMVVIAVDADGNEVEVPEGEGSSVPASMKGDLCSFCFAASQGTQIGAPDYDLGVTLVKVRDGVVYGASGQVLSSPAKVAHSVRAPPVFS